MRTSLIIFIFITGCWSDHFLIKIQHILLKETRQRSYYEKRNRSRVLRSAREPISHQEGHGRVLLGEALHLLQHAAEDRHHPSLVLALRLQRPLGAVLLGTTPQRRSLLPQRRRASVVTLRTRNLRRRFVALANPLRRRSPCRLRVQYERFDHMGDEQAALLLARQKVKEIIKSGETGAATRTTKLRKTELEGYSSTLRRVA